MFINYQKIYAYLVGQIDDVIESMGNLDLVAAEPIRQRLKQALLTAEEMYLDETEND